MDGNWKSKSELYIRDGNNERSQFDDYDTSDGQIDNPITTSQDNQLVSCRKQKTGQKISCVCEICGEKFSHLGNKRRHVLRMHLKLKPDKCEICGKRFGDLSSKKYHRVVHTGDKPFKCSICQKSFNRLSNMKRHVALRDDVKLLECEFCGKRFSESLTLKRHSITHSNKKQSVVIKCEICGRNFRDETVKEKHIKRYLEEIRQGKKKSCLNGFSCELCDYSGMHLSDLHRHVRIHTGEKPFQCEICGMCFTCPSNKNRHLKAHSGLKPYHCEVCGKSFTRESSRKRHMHELHSNNCSSYS